MDTLKNATGMAQPTEEQKKAAYNELPEEQKKKQTYSEWAAQVYAVQYERWMPWIEDQYLRWFGKGDNKASYATKDTLAKSKITGIKQVDQVQDDVHNLIGNQLGENGFLAPVGNMVSKEGINRSERGGKEEDGSYGVAGQIGEGAKSAGGSVVGGAKGVGEGIGNGVGNGVKGLGGALGFGGK
ncbi:hypothetical protein GLAREA_12862 [Glarea lozoyensis ATCC 20868]|uniref:Uncharacterized protein n=1 Tax=Glarea lozoyensis (strain ATCC 20868 / MF5171) TaxID=1116229 RepID=S3CYW8_GLAL2|nr:uncharacterized protein GLAREA_12862 [Glarea lozoyensis ATCC 20868]EPE30139.1 hypothetical protein GLAREA_12862 [Glarea lozoyensis ATCC 20868]